MFNFLKKNYEDVSATTVKEYIKSKNYQIVDVRSAAEYRSGHIKNSILIPLPELKNRLDELDQDKIIVTVCASGMRSASAASMLAKAGYKVVNMSGGMSAWRYAVA